MTAVVDTVEFTVDAKLLRELGERLVGRPHIALAELIKNSYDADARHVDIEFERDRIVVSDDGHGMSRTDFEQRWMRIGTTHKETARRSPILGRTLTGSKGVGRLAVQLLARETRIVSHGLRITDQTPGQGLPETPRLARAFAAEVDWSAAVNAGDLTSVTVPIVRPLIHHDTFPASSRWGTRIELTSLTNKWTPTQLRRLAQEIWSLQPPYEVDVDDPEAFTITLTTRYQRLYDQFDEQMRAILDIWDARITGALVDADDPLDHIEPPDPAGVLPRHLPRQRELDDDGDYDLEADAAADTDTSEGEPRPDKALLVTIELRDGASKTVRWNVPQSTIDQVEFDLRVFDLRNRQPKNVKVATARGYLDQYGGVGIYDQHFRLPYYGADQDWLDLDVASASRLSASRLLPEDLQVSRGMQDLPTSRRIFGRVEISTGHERDVADDHGRPENDALRIQVTRDRLVANDAFEQLRVIIRASLDLYAMERARTRLAKARTRRSTSNRPPSSSFGEVRRAITAARSSMPPEVYAEVQRTVTQAIGDAEAIEEVARQSASILGALATAGMVTLAYDHEISKQIDTVTVLAAELAAVAPALKGPQRGRLERAVGEMETWVSRARDIRQVVDPLTDTETRTTVDRYKARAVAEGVARQIEVLAMGVAIDAHSIPATLRLPRATYPAWQGVFQNLYLNAIKAAVGVDKPEVRVTGGGGPDHGWVAVDDNGYGVDMERADDLWEPFVRDDRAPTDVAAPGLGGTGLGLTIVRMITEEIGVKAAFVPPSHGMSTRVELRWEGARD